MTDDVTRARFLSALFVRVIVRRPNISSFRGKLYDSFDIEADTTSYKELQNLTTDLGLSFKFHAAAAAVLSAVFGLRLFLIAGKEL
jgi:hypothetical protein